MKEEADGTGANAATTCDKTASAYPLLTPVAPADPGLAVVMSSWPTLPEHIKAAVLALVTTATGH
jgi:hypothetical protein